MNPMLGVVSVFLTLMLLSGCSSLGGLTRYQSNGQQVICWEPSHKVNGLVAYVADKVEAH